MYLLQYVHTLRRRWLSVLVTVLVVLGLTMVVTLAMPRKYTATTRIFFSVSGESVSDLAQGSTFAERQMASYAEVATSPIVLAPVVQKLGLPMTPAQLGKSVQATVPVNTVILEIAATDPDPRRAAQIANAVGVELSAAVERLTPNSQGGTKALQATTVAPAEVPGQRSSPNMPLNLAVGLVIGLMGGIGVALLRSTADTRVRTKKDVRTVTDMPIVGTVGYDSAFSQHPVIVRDDPHSAPSEAVRRLRTNLQFLSVSKRPQTVVITSSIRGEGKSTIALNLAVSLADDGARIILVDADLRRPSLGDYLGLEGGMGLTTVLTGETEIHEVVQPFDGRTLDLLPAGPAPPLPGELLGSAAMDLLLEQLGLSYDMVLLDSPPALPVTDAAILSRKTSGVLVVSGADVVRKSQLVDALESLQSAGAHVFGIILNKVERAEAGASLYESSYKLLKKGRKRSPGGPAPDWDWLHAGGGRTDESAMEAAREQSAEGKGIEGVTNRGDGYA